MGEIFRDHHMRLIAGYSEPPTETGDVAPFSVENALNPKVPFVFNSPHSGRFYPIDFIESSRLDQKEIRSSEDAFVDHLYRSAVEFGAPFITAHFPRVYLDVNREPFELDPKMFEGRLPSYVNTRSLRVAGGLGTIARIVNENKEIYRHRLSVEEGLKRIEDLYRPYHMAIRSTLARVRELFGVAVLIDCHSMPSTTQSRGAPIHSDFILGDRFGTSCNPAITNAAADLLTDLGFSVGRNLPYAGGFITEHYGRPEKNIHALQIEINRALYMDEKAHVPSEQFPLVRRVLTRFIGQLTSIDLGHTGSQPLAAE